MKERVSLHPPPFPKQRQLGQTGKVKPGMACYGGGGVRGSQATHHLSSVVNSIATIWRHNCHRRRRLRGSPRRQHHRRRRLPRTDGRQHHGDEIGREGERGGGGGHILHKNELGSPEFRVATVSTSLKEASCLYSSQFV